MPTPNVLRALCAVLAQLYPDKASASRIAKDAGIPIALVALNDRAIDNWHAILQEAEKQDRLALLLAAVNEEYAANPRLRAVMLQLQGWPALFATLAVMGQQQLTPHRVGLGATLVAVLVIIGVWGNRQLTVANEQPTPSPTAIITVAASTPTPQPTPASFTYSVTVRDPEALGDKQQALDYYTQALPLFRTVGDRWGESITRFNMGILYAQLGELAKAEEQLEMVVALDEAIGHPDLESDREVLEQIRTMRAEQEGE